MSKKTFDNIMQGMSEALEYADGNTEHAQVTEYSAMDIKAIRQKSGMSQPVFAKSFGVKVPTLRKWEQGTRKPTGAALTLLKVLDKKPDAVREALSA